MWRLIQTASQLAHDGNSESTFSQAKHRSNPNMKSSFFNAGPDKDCSKQAQAQSVGERDLGKVSRIVQGLGSL